MEGMHGACYACEPVAEMNQKLLVRIKQVDELNDTIAALNYSCQEAWAERKKEKDRAEEAEARVKELEQTVCDIRGQRDHQNNNLMALRAEVSNLRAQLATARADALEEAAVIASVTSTSASADCSSSSFSSSSDCGSSFSGGGGDFGGGGCCGSF